MGDGGETGAGICRGAWGTEAGGGERSGAGSIPGTGGGGGFGFTAAATSAWNKIKSRIYYANNEIKL